MPQSNASRRDGRIPSPGTAQGQNGGRVGPSVLILRYIVEEGVSFFRLEEVRYWAKKRYGVDVDRRRLHDAAKRLTARGVLERPSRGLYRVKDWAAVHMLVSLSSRRGNNEALEGREGIHLQARGETVLEPRQNVGRTDVGARVRRVSGRRFDGLWGRRGFVPVLAGDGCWTVLRWHLSARRGRVWDWLWDLFERAVAFREFYAWLVRWLREELHRMGASKYEIRRRVRRVLQRVRRLLSRVRPVIGAHYRKRFWPLDDLLRLFGAEERLPRMEFGVELWACGE
ncbi:MAG TPA: hypothetical protein EYP33_07890, partial [Pyrodictium sp.]|nr:hypothetical protein [Pyrodictium sp.]